MHGLANTSPDGFAIPFAAGHVRRMPRLTSGPFRYKRYADSYHGHCDALCARRPVKQAVISPSALSLMYPAEGIPGYSREEFIDDLLREHETEIRRCLDKGAHSVQIDFTEGRLAMKIDPGGRAARQLHRLEQPRPVAFLPDERKRIGVHTCPGGDRDSTHSADVDYAELLPSLFELKAGNFYIALAGESDRTHVLKIIRQYMKPDQRVFIGVVAPIDPRIDTPEEVRDRVLEAAEYIPVDQLGTTDDCGFSPFCDDTSTSRDTAFAKIRARVAGTALARAHDRRQMNDARGRRGSAAAIGRAAERASSILLARQRAEAELLRAKEALEAKTRTLAHSLALMRATLESTSNGILATDERRRIRNYNEQFVQLLGASRPEVIGAMDHRHVVRHHSRLLRRCSRLSRARVDAIHESGPAEALRHPGARRRARARAILEGAARRQSQRRPSYRRLQRGQSPNAGAAEERSQKAAEERTLLLESERTARARRRARERDEGRVPRDPLARAAHAAQRDPRLGAGAAHRARRTRPSCVNGLEAIERNARVQTQLIEDLLDMSRITSGKLRLDVQPVDPLTFVEAALETVRPAADAKAHPAGEAARPGDGPDLRRPGPAAAGRLEPALERDQVHAAGTARSGSLLQRVDSHIEIDGRRHRDRHQARSSCRTCSSASDRRTASTTRSSAGSGWAFRSCGIWWSCTAAPCARRAPARDRAATYRAAAHARSQREYATTPSSASAEGRVEPRRRSSSSTRISPASKCWWSKTNPTHATSSSRVLERMPTRSADRQHGRGGARGGGERSGPT